MNGPTTLVHPGTKVSEVEHFISRTTHIRDALRSVYVEGEHWTHDEARQTDEQRRRSVAA